MARTGSQVPSAKLWTGSQFRSLSNSLTIGMLVLGRQANPHSLGYVSSPFANPSDPCCPVTSGGSGDVCPEGRALHGGSGEGRALHGGSGELCPRDRALHGGSGTVYPQDRASKVPDAVRVCLHAWRTPWTRSGS